MVTVRFRRGAMLIIIFAALIAYIRLPASAQGKDDLAALYSEVGGLREAGKYAEAIAIAARLLELAEKSLGQNHLNVGAVLNVLANLYQDQGRYDEAEPLYKRDLAIREKLLGTHHPEVGTSLNNLAGLYWSQGRYEEAATLSKRSLDIRETALGSDHPTVASAVNNLALLYEKLGRLDEAAQLLKRSLDIRQKKLGFDHPDVASSLDHLGGLYQSQGRFDEAEPLLKRGLAIREKALGPRHPHISLSLDNLGGLKRDQGRHEEAEMLLKRSLAIRESGLGANHPSISESLDNLASLYSMQKLYSEAEKIFMRSHSVRSSSLGPDHPLVGTSLSNLAALAFLQQNWELAVQYDRESTEVIKRRTIRGLDAGEREGQGKQEAARFSWRFWRLIKASFRKGEATPANAIYARGTFDAAQWARSSEAATSIAQMAVRSAKGNPALATPVRERQDLIAEWKRRDGTRTAAVSQAADKRDAKAEAANVARLSEIDTRISAIDKRLAAEFPDYAAFASPEPLTVEQVQADLRPDEALVLFLDTPEWKPTPEESFIWVVTKTDMRWVRSDLGTAALTREVAALRCGLDYTSWRDGGEFKCQKLLTNNFTIDDYDAGQPLPFDHARANKVYTALFGEFRDLIKDKHLLLIPSGPLTQLPFQVLISELPRGNDHRSIRWLARDHALTVLPAVSSLKALRRVGKPSAANKPMIGFGNPLLDGDQKHTQFGTHFKKLAEQSQAHKSCAQTGVQRTAALRGLRRSLMPMPQRAGTVDVAEVRILMPLPETADELCEVARDLKADVGEVRLGARATEREVKALSASGKLADYRILHFATHGTLAGQLSGTSEPGLILTPPATATEDDDGYLSAGEIAGLKLDADWVMLSACNTAGGAGGVGDAEALGGLARAFFYAQARATGFALGGQLQRDRDADHLGGRRDYERQVCGTSRGAPSRHADDDRLRQTTRGTSSLLGAVCRCWRGGSREVAAMSAMPGRTRRSGSMTFPAGSGQGTNPLSRESVETRRGA